MNYTITLIVETAALDYAYEEPQQSLLKEDIKEALMAPKQTFNGRYVGSLYITDVHAIEIKPCQ